MKKEINQKMGNIKKHARLVMPVKIHNETKQEPINSQVEEEFPTDDATEFNWNDFLNKELDQFTQHECFYGMESIDYQ